MFESSARSMSDDGKTDPSVAATTPVTSASGHPPGGSAAGISQKERAILARISAGDHRAAVLLCSEHYADSLGRLCMALLGSQQDAEEAVQETLLAAHQAMESYRGDGSVRGWLFGIARRQCARSLERRQRRQSQLQKHLTVVPDPGDEGSEQQSPERMIAIKRRAERVRSGLMRLKPSERDALVLRYQSGLSFREIGAICQIDEAAARKRASRGLKSLRKLITQEEVE